MIYASARIPDKEILVILPNPVNPVENLENTMRIGYFDCFSGVSGDMMLGALLHAGVDEATWRAELTKLNVPGYDLQIETVVKEGISAIDVDVVLHAQDQGHGRHLADIEEILNR